MKRSNIKLEIHVENEQLIVHGTPSESAGCVLRGIVYLSLQEPTKVKSINLYFNGTMTITWTEPLGNGHERLFREVRNVINHAWTLLPRQSKQHQLPPGEYPYEFEMVLPGCLPESIHIAKFYQVQYQLKAIVERSTFLPNHVARRSINLYRQVSPVDVNFMEPVFIANQWAGKLDYEISMPTSTYTHGDQIPVTIRATPLMPGVKIRYLSCTFKEYMTCRATNGWFSGRPRGHSRVLFHMSDDKFGSGNCNQDSSSFVEWSKSQVIPVPRSADDVQCSVQNNAVKIRHKLKFVLSIQNPDGHVSELRACVPITICAVSTTGLPAYGEITQSLPYDPLLMMALLHHPQQDENHILWQLPSYTSIAHQPCLEIEPSPPRYEELPCL
ncbi:hypothetical protein DFQ28_011453 [Apophysomyces sp. BC1034]|nr:hypothetical protein DFQ30_011070 [Apophysomyces sp. BC1015]KAG0181156.1 hypothetical protein DFQ29_009192 [Apophysomyces sp. BC1021]KAG0191614.1 hypothetical protein DFQ28_011453 [Apophysomyces sp. BC1034]